MVSKPKPSLIIGVLALQGAFDLHKKILNSLNIKLELELVVVEVRNPKHIENLDGLIIPGGESTVLSKLLRTSNLYTPLKELIENGLPVLATCAGIILLSNDMKVLDCEVQRNAYGTQIDSFEADVDFELMKSKCRVSFIRAPKILQLGSNVEAIAFHNEEVVGVLSGKILALTCHPEALGEETFHEFFVSQILERVASGSGKGVF